MRKKKYKNPSVTIVLSNFNGGRQPLECLKSIKNLRYPKDKLETIVIDNASTDGSREKIAKLYPWAKLVKLKKDIGLPASLNLGIKKTQSDFLFIANDDIVFEKNSLRAMVNYLKNHSETGVLGGKVYYKDHPKKLSQSAAGFNFYTGGLVNPKKQAGILWLQSCAIMVPRLVFDKVGLFDPGFYPLYFDDFDFCLRVTRAGFKLKVLPQAIFWHGAGKTTSNYPSKTVYYWWYKNKIRFMFKNANPLQLACFMPIQIATAIFKSIGERQLVVLPLIRAAYDNFKAHRPLK